MMEIIIRRYDSKIDDPYIYSTWVRYSYYSPIKPVKLDKHSFFAIKSQEIKAVLENGTTHIACIKGEPFMIMGYIAVHDGEIKWLCIKKDYRNQGIEGLLIKSMKGKIDERDQSDSKEVNGAGNPSVAG